MTCFSIRFIVGLTVGFHAPQYDNCKKPRLIAVLPEGNGGVRYDEEQRMLTLSHLRKIFIQKRYHSGVVPICNLYNSLSLIFSGIISQPT